MFFTPSFLPALCTLSFLRVAPTPPPPLFNSPGRGNLRPQLDSAMQDVSDLYLLMEETEKQAVRRALLEERGRYCTFINMLQPVVVRPTALMCTDVSSSGCSSCLNSSPSCFSPCRTWRSPCWERSHTCRPLLMTSPC